MSILPFLVAVIFFLIINFYLALVAANIIVVVMKYVVRYPVESNETMYLILLCCVALLLGVRVILLNFYDFQDMSAAFLWPFRSFMPKDLVWFLNTSMNIM
jgi:hypothetical protein